ncbi:MAG TPA: outer membrane protein assembly factor, partial [Myxococcaceae bacterium]|nr:outer membrane protein assembly factor [Myxococcaceae bacterium]
MKLRIPFALMLGAALAFCSGASPALAQTEHSGETVTGVEVRLPAGADARAAIDRIAVRKGQRLSVRALRRSVERLYASGQYADVVVRARPDGEWVALVFELEPLRSIAEVRVQGNTVLSSAQLLSAAKLSRREAFFP